MSAAPISLAQLQRTMAAAVMLPLTPGEQMQTHAPDGSSMSVLAESFIAPNSRLSAFERLEIYNRQYWFRVLGALAEDFPALRAVLGAAAFEALSIAYLTAHPSRSFALRNLGSKFPDWLASHAQFAGRRHSLALDVARIEWAFVEAFDSAAHTPLTADQVATLDAGSRLSLQPHLQLIALSYATADDLVLSLHQQEKRQAGEAGIAQGGDETPESDAPAKLPRLRRRPTWLAAHRVNLSVYYRRLQREEFLTLAAIRQGLPLAEAIETGFAGSPIPPARRIPRIRQWFAHWAQLGWICAPDLESLLPPSE
jgi:hypothetical protein